MFDRVIARDIGPETCREYADPELSGIRFGYEALVLPLFELSDLSEMLSVGKQFIAR